MSKPKKIEALTFADVIRDGMSGPPHKPVYKVGDVVRLKPQFARASALKRYGVSDLRYEVVDVGETPGFYRLKKLYTKSQSKFTEPFETVDAWYEKV